jgi:hypothetical protein
MYPILFNYFTLNFNMVFTRPKNDTLLRFVNINNVKNYKIQNRTNYLLISFSKDNKMIDNDFSIYNYIKDNKKPLILISNEDDKKYSYLIKDDNQFKCKYDLNYNQKKYRYLFDITSNKIDERQTYWNIEAKVNEIANFKLIIYQLMNWFNFIINTNIKNYYLKKYIIMCYLLNLSL